MVYKSMTHNEICKNSALYLHYILYCKERKMDIGQEISPSKFHQWLRGADNPNGTGIEQNTSADCSLCASVVVCGSYR